MQWPNTGLGSHDLNVLSFEVDNGHLCLKSYTFFYPLNLLSVLEIGSLLKFIMVESVSHGSYE